MADDFSGYTPKLTLEPDVSAPEAEIKAPAVPEIELSQLSPEEQKAVLDFSGKIDIMDANMVLQYGAGAQKNIADFSAGALNNVRSKDMGEVGGMLTDLVVELKGFNYDGEKKGLFRRAQNKIASLKAQYDKAEVNVNKISEQLESHQVVLLKDVALMDKMYQMNKDYFKELSMYIMAGKRKLKECVEVKLPEMQSAAKRSGLPEDAQAASDYANMCNRFEKKIHDLELTRMVSIQMAPQIRMIQNNDSLMVEKIQSSLVNTIPLWKSQMVLALGIHHSQQAMEAQRQVTDMTNELLRKNAEKLKTGSLEIAKESERGVVDIETLKLTNQSLIETIDEVRRIQDEGAQKRREAETELAKIEGELKQKLLELRNGQSSQNGQ